MARQHILPDNVLPVQDVSLATEHAHFRTEAFPDHLLGRLRDQHGLVCRELVLAIVGVSAHPVYVGSGGRGQVHPIQCRVDLIGLLE